MALTKKQIEERLKQTQETLENALHRIDNLQERDRQASADIEKLGYWKNAVVREAERLNVLSSDYTPREQLEAVINAKLDGFIAVRTDILKGAMWRVVGEAKDLINSYTFFSNERRIGRSFLRIAREGLRGVGEDV